MAHSFTALSQFENCPRQYFEMRVAKNFKDEDSEYSMWGKRIHDSVAKTIDTGAPLMEGIERHDWIPRMTDAAKAANAVVQTETKAALNKDFKPVDWWAKDVWLRAVIDLAIVGTQSAFLWDWKSGKVKEDDTQLKLFAGVGFALWPDVQWIHTRYAWLAHKQPPTKKTYHRALAHREVWQVLLPRFERVDAAIKSGVFQPRPSGLCRFCPVTTCEFQSKK